MHESTSQSFLPVRSGAAFLLALVLVACRDPGPPPAETVPPAATPEAVTERDDAPASLLEVEVFEGARLSLDGSLRSRGETPGPDGVRHVVRVEHRYPSTAAALAEIEQQMKAAGYHVTLSDDDAGARVFSPGGQKGNVQIVERDALEGLELAQPDATGLVSFYWIAPVR